ncbi:hypothetical protein [Nocardia sp. NPDC005366]|uniref:hypothetical protein n=1 Tax=Nocardia sp. NPDC005366 TaxID=3156878 RepID=UPI0033AC93CC
MANSHRETRRIGLAEIVGEYGAAAVFQRLADLRVAGPPEAVAAIEQEMRKLIGAAEHRDLTDRPVIDPYAP